MGAERMPKHSPGDVPSAAQQRRAINVALGRTDLKQEAVRQKGRWVYGV